MIASGKVGATDLAHLVLLSLAQPREERERVEWEEILLVDSQTTQEQITALLTIFEEELASLPAEVGPLPRYQRAVYHAPLTYIHDTQRSHLHVTLTRDQLTRVRASEKYGQSWPREWSYDGPMALRGEIERQL